MRSTEPRFNKNQYQDQLLNHITPETSKHNNGTTTLREMLEKKGFNFTVGQVVIQELDGKKYSNMFSSQSDKYNELLDRPFTTVFNSCSISKIFAKDNDAIYFLEGGINTVSMKKIITTFSHYLTTDPNATHDFAKYTLIDKRYLEPYKHFEIVCGTDTMEQAELICSNLNGVGNEKD